MAFNSAVAGQRPTAAQWNDYVFRRVVADCTSSTRPSSPVEGQPIFETDTDKMLLHDGTSWIELGKLGAWTTYTPTWAASGTAPAIGNGTLSGRYIRLFGRTFATQVLMVAGSTTTFGTGIWSFTTPSSLTVASVYPYGVGFAGQAANWAVTVQATDTTFVPYVSTSSTDTRLTVATATAPTAWSTGHFLTFTITWESTT